MKTQMIIVRNSLTPVRAKVIANRTRSAFMAGAKSVMIEILKRQMVGGMVHFAYMKKDGSIREAWGTINPDIVRKYVNGSGISRERYATTAYFDVERGAWRSFRWESIVTVF